MQRIGIHGTENRIAPDTLIGRIRNFVGVYSGRIGADEFKAQLGIVWKEKALKEILQTKRPGKAPCLIGSDEYKGTE